MMFIMKFKRKQMFVMKPMRIFIMIIMRKKMRGWGK